MSRGQRKPTSYKAFTTDSGTSGTLKSTRPTSTIIGSRRRWDAQLLLHAGHAQPLNNQALFDSILSLDLMPLMSPSLRNSPDPYLSVSPLIVPVPPSYFTPTSWMGGEVPGAGRTQYENDKQHSIIFSRQRYSHSTKSLESLALRTILSIFIPLVLPLLSQEDYLGAQASTSVDPTGSHIPPIRSWSYTSSTTEATSPEAQDRQDRKDASHDARTHSESADKVPPASYGVLAKSHPGETRKALSLTELLIFT